MSSAFSLCCTDCLTTKMQCFSSLGGERGKVMSCASLLCCTDCGTVNSFLSAISFHTLSVSGQDFSALDPLKITFAVGMTESCAMVSIIDDDDLEGDHEFTVSISTTEPPITIDSTTIEVTIEDNEGMDVL